MILAAGLSTRLRPLTDETPKPLLPFWHLRLLDFTLAYLRHSGIDEASVNLHHGRRLMLEALSGGKLPLGVRSFEEPILLGTGGGIKNMGAFATDETFGVVNCDFLTDIDLQAACEFHRAHQALATMVLVEDPKPTGYKPVGVDAEGRIAAFPYGKAPGGATRMGFFSGIHIFDREIFKELPGRKIFDINQDIYARLIERGAPVFGHMTRARWHDVGEIDLYAKTQWDLLAQPSDWMRPLLGGFLPREGQIFISKDAKIAKDSELAPPCLIGAGAQVGAHAGVGPLAVIGPRARIGMDARVEQSIVFPGAEIRPKTSVVNEIVMPDGTSVAI
ncbi:MAG: NDP-sugar synthase [Pseudomonadota bacterium]